MLITKDNILSFQEILRWSTTVSLSEQKGKRTCIWYLNRIFLSEANVYCNMKRNFHTIWNKISYLKQIIRSADNFYNDKKWIFPAILSKISHIQILIRFKAKLSEIIFLSLFWSDQFTIWRKSFAYELFILSFFMAY